MLVVVSDRDHMPNHYFSVHPSRTSVALIAHSSTGDVASTNGTGILCSRAWIRMYVARHLEEHEWCSARSSL